MLLVTMGTQPLKCNRIVDAILEANIKDDIIIQTYFDDEYCNRDNVKFVKFLPYKQMENLIQKADTVVVSGTGGVFRALSYGKKVIIFPRLGKHGEATDDHGNDMRILKDQGYAEFVGECDNFNEVYERSQKRTFRRFKSNTDFFVKHLLDEMEKL